MDTEGNGWCITSHVVPTNLFNFHPFGTVWIADMERGKELWIQTGKDFKKPKWKRLGEYLEWIALDNPELFTEMVTRPILDHIPPVQK